MQSYRDNEQITDSNAAFELTIFTTIGGRAEQQDSFGYSLRAEEGLAVICDGMGGLSGGRLASSTAVKSLLDAYARSGIAGRPGDFMMESLHEANRKIAAFPSPGGSTEVAALIRQGRLWWTSVGDSRGYLLRGEEFIQFTLDQNYHTVLREKKSAGLISGEEYRRESEKKDALVSYLGIPRLDLIDYSKTPLPLRKDDKVVLMSDGLYKVLSDAEIFRILDNFSNITEAVRALEIKAENIAQKQRIHRDNMTVAVIRIK